MKEFVKMSKYAGMREDLVQAGGGNSAVKIAADKMLIKASGYQLAELDENCGYAIVNPQIIKKAFLEAEDIDYLDESCSKKILAEAFIEGERPSIETFLHSILGKYSLHTHPIVVNALTCRMNGKEELLELFPEALIVPYATPGVELAKAYFKEYKEYLNTKKQEPRLIFLMNHGFITSADTADEVIQITEEVISKIESYLGVDMQEYHNVSAIHALYDEGIEWLVTDKNVLEAYASLNGEWEHYFCPDCVVFLGKKMLCMTDVNNKDEFASFACKYGTPVVIIYQDNLYIHASSVKKALDIQSVLSFSAQVMNMNMGVNCNLLSDDEENLLLNWDAEKYRKQMK